MHYDDEHIVGEQHVHIQTTTNLNHLDKVGNKHTAF